jgi:hypothetical protein
MAPYRQGPRGRRGALRSLWARAGERAGDGAGALFARLDAKDAQDAQGIQGIQGAPVTQAAASVEQTRAEAAATFERLAARIRAGAWSSELAALAARAARLERDEG